MCKNIMRNVTEILFFDKIYDDWRISINGSIGIYPLELWVKSFNNSFFDLIKIEDRQTMFLREKSQNTALDTSSVYVDVGTC